MPDGRTDVLLIEDDEDDYFLTKELFAELPAGQYHLDRVASYAEALDAFENCVHDVYLVDYRLGPHNGLELITEAQRRGCVAPMIMLTGQRELDIDLQAMHAGAVDYLIKGQFDSAKLERRMRYALQQQRHAESIRRANQELEERVEERTSELARVNKSLQNEIAERVRAEEALRDADRRKDDFLAILAHELRNPLASLSSALQLLQLDVDDPAKVAELHGVMSRQVAQLVRLIEDLLDVSRISRGKLHLRRERVAIADVIAAGIDMSRGIIDSCAHRLHVENSPCPLVVDGDKVRLTQVVNNLLVNAAKYTPRGGQIDISVGQENGQAIVRIRDNGIGIPADMLSQIFAMFTQVDASKTRSRGGLGIGLTLVKTLVEMHNGSVTAASAGPGCGSEFTVRLPLLSDTEFSAASAASASALPDDALQRLRILIVDDNESAAHLLSRLLERLGQHVHAVNSAGAALDILNSLQPQIIISDIGMPGLSGYELAQRIRSHPGIAQPLLIALTGYGHEADRQAALAAGFDLHLTKPASLQTLRELLSSLADRS